MSEVCCKRRILRVRCFVQSSYCTWKVFFFFSTKRQQIKQQSSGIKPILRDSQGPRGTASFSHSFSREGRSAARDPLCVYTTSSLSGSPPFVCCGASGASTVLLFVAVFFRCLRKWRCCQAFLATAAALADHVRLVGTRVPRNLKSRTPVRAALGTSQIFPDSDVLFCSPPFV